MAIHGFSFGLRWRLRALLLYDLGRLHRCPLQAPTSFLGCRPAKRIAELNRRLTGESRAERPEIGAQPAICAAETDLSLAQRGANLVEQLPEASGVAGRSAKARMRVNLRKFTDRGSKLREIYGGGEFERCL